MQSFKYNAVNETELIQTYYNYSYHIIMHLYRYTTDDMHYTKPPKVDSAWPMYVPPTRAIFGPSGICK